MISLTETQREQVIATLSEQQKEVIAKFKKKSVHSMFLNDIFSIDYEWEFHDYQESNCYRDKEVAEEFHLYCHCGKEVKYQYILTSKNTNEQVKLSLQHFADHTNIPKSLARKIANGVYKLEQHLDDVLIKISKGVTFQENIAKMLDIIEQSDLPQRLVEVATTFKSVNLPLCDRDYESIMAYVHKNSHTLYKQTSHGTNGHKTNFSPKIGTKKPKGLTDSSFIEDIITILDTHYYEKNTLIDLRELTYFLEQEMAYDGERLHGYVGPVIKRFATKTYPELLKEESLWVYRKLSSEKIQYDKLF